MTDIDVLLQDYRPQHSNWQMDYFITAQHGITPYGMYMQALRELHGRHQAIQSLRWQMDDLDARIIRAKRWMRILPTSRRRKRLEQFYAQRRSFQETLASTTFELRRFQMQASLLKEQLGILDEESHEALDRDMWYHKLKSMAAVELIVQGQLGARTVEAIAATPRDFRTRLLADLQRTAELKRWLESKPTLMEAQVDELETNASGNHRGLLYRSVSRTASAETEGRTNG